MNANAFKAANPSLRDVYWHFADAGPFIALLAVAIAFIATARPMKGSRR